MPRIHQLSDDLINKIAAGEVVERPASVVKELVENSLDAGARSVRVLLVRGGRELVEVADDGSGMEAADAELALRRHATSKIASADDLAVIATLGFRGEALPSIGAVSLLSLETAAADGEGTRLDVAFGELVGRGPCSRPRGTTVSVRDLFERLPARRKFLRSEPTELRHAVASLTALAFARPDVTFRLDHGHRTLLELPGVPDAGRRLVDLLGADRASTAVPVRRATPSATVAGFLVPTRGVRETVVTVNGRAVRDRLLSAAANRALRGPGGMIEADLYLAINVSSETVDVNVHPAKAEVRFAEPGAVMSAITVALAEGVVALGGPVTVRRVVTVPSSLPPPFLPWGSQTGHPRQDEVIPTGGPMAREAAPGYAGDRETTSRISTPLGRYIGQYRQTYLVLEDESGLLLVDQHVAHERVLVERVLDKTGPVAVQHLLIPELVELPPQLAILAEGSAPELASLGLEVEPVSGHTIRVIGIPAALGRPEPASLVEGLLRDLAAESSPGDTVRERAAASLACRAAIKKNRLLSRAEAEQLLLDLSRTRERHRCPHGRPIVLRLPHDEIEHRIGRR
ncbi:MAG: DNA mismatch repair endonuclease MutL [Acidobacteriota bacterium]